MKRKHMKYLFAISLTLGIMTCLLAYVPDCFAGGESTPGRRLFNNIMLWVNFGILVFFFLKYAKKPLLNYLRSVRSKIEADLSKIDGDLNDTKSLIDTEADKMKGLEQHIKEDRERILEIGRKEKEKIIEEGRIWAEKMIQDAKTYSDYKTAKARKALSDEMVDIAVSMAAEKLLKKMSEEDNEKLINQFITNLPISKQRLN